MTTLPRPTSVDDLLADELTRRGADRAEPLSATQRRVWLLTRMSHAYRPVIVAGYRTAGTVSLPEAQLRLGVLAARQDALRSVFTEVAGRPARLVLPVGDVDLRLLDLTCAEPGDDRVPGALGNLVSAPFAPDQGPLIRGLLVHTPGGGSELTLVGHQLVTDLHSLDLLAAAVLGDAPYDAPPLAGDGIRTDDEGDPDDIARWARELTMPAATEVRGYWPRPAVRGHHARTVSVPVPGVDPADAAELRVRAVAAWLALLSRRHGGGAAACGVWLDRTGGRIGPEAEMRPVRCEIDADTTLGELAGDATVRLAEPSVASFARLLEVCPPGRDLSRPPYVQTAVRVLDGRNPLPGTPGVYRVPAAGADAEFDVLVNVWMGPDGVGARLDYDADLLDEETVRDLAAGFGRILAAEPASPAERAPLLDADGAQRALDAGRGAATPPTGGSLVDRIADTVARVPDAVALRFDGGAGRRPDRAAVITLTYRELWLRSGATAAALRGRGIGAGDRVAIWLDRGPEAIITLLGVLRAGAAYVPLDARQPEDRVRWIIEDAGARLVITEDHRRPAMRGAAALTPTDLAVGGGAELPAVPASAPAYVIFTSGSTGWPKGVVVGHASVVNNLAWRQRRWPLGETDRVLHNHPFGFDPAVWAVFWPLITGAAVVLAEQEILDDPAALVRYVRDAEVTVLGGVPSLLLGLLQQPAAGGCRSVRLVLSGGEPLSEELVRLARESLAATVVNLYGPTEATIDALGWEVPERAEADERAPRPLPVGTPVDNTVAHVVDADLRPVPDGVPGEILLGGRCLALGYRRRSGLTAARFVPDPFDDADGGRLYRTGDLGRRLPDGAVQFLGRIDRQVKVRGHRIELAEVEAVLIRHPGVRAAAVIALDAGTELARLAAALVVDDGLTTDTLRADLAAALPAYSVPERIAFVGELPLTSNGKLDMPAVTALFDAAPTPGDDEVTAPRTDLEAAVADAFTQVLRVDQIDVHADFFALGGTSIMLARLASLLAARHDVEIPLHEFFRVPTVAAVAATIELYRAEGLAGVLGRRHASTLEADAVLDPSIGPGTLPHADWADPSRVLLTGATGYLGLHLLDELLRTTSAEVVCLCRARDPGHALARIVEGLEQYEIDPGDRLSRIRCVTGDLGAERLGLTAGLWDELSRTVDMIYHNGALVNFVYPYSALREPNVAGTQRILELACTARLKAVHHVSTVDTLLATHTPRPFTEDDAPLRSAVGVPAGYTGSKWVAEKIVDVARRRGVPVTVFRPGLILGHSRTGATQTIDYLLVALRGFLPMRILPDYPRIFDVVPVDYVARAIAHISLRPEALGGFYHLFNPAPVTIRAFCGWVATYGYEFDIVPFDRARERALAVGPDHPLYPLVPLIRDAEPEPHRALDPRYFSELDPDAESARTREMLAGSGIACPPATEADAHAVLDYLVRVGFLPAPGDIPQEGA